MVWPIIGNESYVQKKWQVNEAKRVGGTKLSGREDCQDAIESTLSDLI